MNGATIRAPLPEQLALLGRIPVRAARERAAPSDAKDRPIPPEASGGMGRRLTFRQIIGGRQLLGQTAVGGEPIRRVCAGRGGALSLTVVNDELALIQNETIADRVAVFDPRLQQVFDLAIVALIQAASSR